MKTRKQLWDGFQQWVCLADTQESGRLLQPLMGVTRCQNTPGKPCISRSWSQGHMQKWRSGMSQPATGRIPASTRQWKCQTETSRSVDRGEVSPQTTSSKRRVSLKKNKIMRLQICLIMLTRGKTWSVFIFFTFFFSPLCFSESKD